MQVQVGDKAGCDGSRPFDHGCMDYYVAEVVAIDGDDVRLRVTEAQSCSNSAHGCGKHVFAEVGDHVVVRLSEMEEMTENDWASDVKWDISNAGQGISLRFATS